MKCSRLILICFSLAGLKIWRRSVRELHRACSDRFATHLVKVIPTTLMLLALFLVNCNRSPGAEFPPQQTTEKLDSQKDTAKQDKPKLPWDRDPIHKVPNVTRPSERELLVDVSDEELLKVKENQPIQSDANLFAKLLFRVDRFGLDNLHHLSRKNQEDFPKLENEPGFHRFKIFPVSGKAIAWEKKELDESIGELFDLPFYFRIKVRLDSGINAILFTKTIPSAWKQSPQISEDVSATALFTNQTRSTKGTPILNFIASKVRWAPAGKSDLVIKRGHALLGSAGFDLGLLDTLPRQNKLQFDEDDTEPFFQMMAAARMINQSKDPPNWTEILSEFNLIENLKNPAAQHGEFRLLTFNVRNITRIRVDDDYVRERIDIEEYFQLDGFLKTDSRISYKSDSGDGAVFTKKYPVTVCVTRLPKEWEAGPDQNYQATFPVFFYKVWAYPSDFQDQFSEDALQYSPMFVALDPVRYSDSITNINWGNLALFLLVGIGVLSVWTSYFIKRAKKDKSTIQFQLPAKVNIQQTESSSPNEPVAGMPVIVEDDPHKHDD